MKAQGMKGCYSCEILMMKATSPSETSVTTKRLHAVMSKGCFHEAEKLRYKERQIWREIFLNHKWIHINDKIRVTTTLKN